MPQGVTGAEMSIPTEPCLPGSSERNESSLLLEAVVVVGLILMRQYCQFVNSLAPPLNINSQEMHFFSVFCTITFQCL